MNAEAAMRRHKVPNTTAQGENTRPDHIIHINDAISDEFYLFTLVY